MKQVDRTHYAFGRYMSKFRWSSLWYQLREVLENDSVGSVLEVGPGSGLMGLILASYNISYKSIDIAEDLNPTYVGNLVDLADTIGQFDCVVAFQVLEHMPYEDSLQLLTAMARAAKSKVIISVPNLVTKYSIEFTLPRRKKFRIPFRKLNLFRRSFIFNGEHYWELGCKEVTYNRFIKDISSIEHVKLIRDFRVDENPYHHFFIFEAPK